MSGFGGGNGLHHSKGFFRPSTYFALTTNVAAVSFSNATTFSVPTSNQQVGDLLAISVACFSTKIVSSASGGGVTTWTVSNSGAEGIFSVALVWGIITTAGSQTVTITMSGAGSGAARFAEIAPTLPGTISADGSYTANAGASIKSLTLPTLTPSTTHDCYVLATYPTASGTVTVTPGFTNVYPSADTIYWNSQVTAPIACTIDNTGSGTITAVGQLFQLTLTNPT